MSTQTPLSSAEAALEDLLPEGLESARVVVVGPDLLDLARRLAPRLGPGGSLLGVHDDEGVVDAARASSGAPGPGEAPADFQSVAEDLRLSRSAADDLVAALGPVTLEGFRAAEAELERLGREQPLVADESVDVAVVTGLRFLSRPDRRARMLKELHRVVRRGGRLIVLDAVSDEEVAPGRFAGDGALGATPVPCSELLDSVAAAGFYGVVLQCRDAEPWREADGVEFRRVAITAHKGKEGPCWEHFQAVMYRGPFKSVEDDDGHVYERGQQIAVCKKTFGLLQNPPYRGFFEYSEPRSPISAEEARPFPCNRPSAVRDPLELKQGAASGATGGPTGIAESPGGAALAAKRKGLVVFTRSSADAGSVRDLESVRSGAIEAGVVDLATNEDAPMPAQLRLRLSMSGDACLPAVVLDGVVIALGGIPGREELERLVAEGRPRGTLPLDAAMKEAASNASCEGPGCC